VVELAATKPIDPKQTLPETLAILPDVYHLAKVVVRYWNKGHAEGRVLLLHLGSTVL